MKKNINQCLMIETRDKRQFFTPEQNYTQLVEFANTFDAEISIVKLENGDVLDLPRLAEAISNPRVQPLARFQLIQKKIGRTSKSLTNKNMTASREIKDHVRNQFANGQVVDFKELMQKFATYNLSYNAIAAHLFKLKREFAAQGFCIQKVAAGKYRALPKAEVTGN